MVLAQRSTFTGKGFWPERSFFTPKTQGRGQGCMGAKCSPGAGLCPHLDELPHLPSRSWFWSLPLILISNHFSSFPLGGGWIIIATTALEVASARLPRQQH